MLFESRKKINMALFLWFTILVINILAFVLRIKNF